MLPDVPPHLAIDLNPYKSVSCAKEFMVLLSLSFHCSGKNVFSINFFLKKSLCIKPNVNTSVKFLAVRRYPKFCHQASKFKNLLSPNSHRLSD